MAMANHEPVPVWRNFAVWGAMGAAFYIVTVWPGIRFLRPEDSIGAILQSTEAVAFLGLGLVFLELEQLQLELIQQGPPFRRLTEPIMLQLGNPLLELLDAQGLLAQLGAISLALGQQYRLQRFDVVGQRSIGSLLHIAISDPTAGQRNDLPSARVAMPHGLSPLPVDATYAAVAASQCLPAGSPAAPA